VPPVPELDAALTAAVDALAGEPRDGQRQMAEAVADAIRTGDHLLVQAGTGTGKSLAYLVPALLHSLDAKRPVVVATATIALQRQLVERDLPLVTRALRPLLGRELEFAILKGRQNYLCMHRLGEGSPVEPGDGGSAGDAAEVDVLFDPGPRTALGRDVRRIRTWAQTTTTGDRDELVPAPLERSWRALSVSSHECLGAARCGYAADCFSEQARERARRVDVVVTNHAMLAIDAFAGIPLLPEHDVVVVDEAHELVDRATTAVTDELTVGAVERAARRVGRYVSPETRAALGSAAGSLETALAGSEAGRLVSLPADLLDALVLVRDGAHSAMSDSSGRDAGDGGGPEGARVQARAAVDEILEMSERILGARERDVVWVSKSDTRPAVLRRAPLSVAALLRERLFGESTVILTSATLQIGGSFEPVARSLGLLSPPGYDPVGTPGSEPGGEPGSEPRSGPDPESEEPANGDAPASADATDADDTDWTGTDTGTDATDWTGIDVGSPFDYRRQAILYVARHLPPPGRSGLHSEVLDEIAELVDAAGGSALGLFSSMRAAQEAAAMLRGRTACPVLCQGDDATAELVRRFAEDQRTCLFGTLSLWQGVDVPGDACRLVLIDRIPFPRPDDPLVKARQDASGSAGFMAVSAASAALLLAQGAGRLIRSGTDRGVVAVLDPRLVTARYGSFMLRSLPPFWVTTDRDQARRSLRALRPATAAEI
jgi:ATP-dependent DNA helicase DinG